MADVTMAATQDAIADSLLGDPQDQQVAEQPVTEQQPEGQQDFQPTEPAEQQVEETTDEWFPSEQEKVFPDEVLARYAQRYGLDENSLSNPQIRQLVADKINSDIFIQQQRQQEQFVEPEAEEPTPQPQLTREQYFNQLDQMVAQRTDPQVAQSFYAGFMKVFGVPDAEIAKTAPAQALPFTQLMTKYLINGINTFLPDFLQAQLSNQISQIFPEFGEMYERSSYSIAWDRVRNSNPEYADLPAYGTKQFSAQLREAAARIPGFDEMQFTDQQGRPLPPADNYMRKYGMLAQAIIKGQVDPALVQKAAAAQVNSQRRAAVRRSAGALGSGQSQAASGNRSRGASQFQTNQDIFDDETMAVYNREHGKL